MTYTKAGFCALLFLCFKHISATKHSFKTYRDGRLIIGPVGVPFGFLAGGQYQLKVTNFQLLGTEQSVKRAEAGFYLQKFQNEAAFHQYVEEILEDDSCVFEQFKLDDDGAFDNMDDDGKYSNVGEDVTAKDGIFLSMKNQKKWKESTVEYNFERGEEGLYVLMYQVCNTKKQGKIRSSFSLDFHFTNTDIWGNISYLTAGEMKLPAIFMFFGVSYAVALFVWMTNILEIHGGSQGHFGPSGKGARVYQIHYAMGALLLFKFLSVFFRGLRYHRIRIVGHAEIWTAFSLAFGFIKGIFLFTVIVLIGSGWSFVKPFLTRTEKKMVAFVLALQVLNQIAIIVLSNETEGERSYHGWTAALHLVDIICCCSVLLPIVWHVNSLERSVSDETGEETTEYGEEEDGLVESTSIEDKDGEKGAILGKLKLFRSFYLLVVGYIYTTRILVFLFATMLDYRHTWVRYFVVEIVTLTFYIVVGFLFRPVNDQVYSRLKKEIPSEEGVEMQSSNSPTRH